MRHPEHHALDRHAGQVDAFLRAGDVGHHHARLALEHPGSDVLDRLGQAPHQVEQRQRRHRLGRALQFIHRRLGREHAPQPLPAADREFQQHHAELVAEPIGALGRAQVHRHHRAHGRVVHVHAAPAQIGAQRPGHAGDQDVVDLRAQRRADRLDVGQRHRSGPRHALPHSERAFQRRWRIVGAQQFRAEHAGACQHHAGLAQHVFGMRDGVDRRIDRRPHLAHGAPRDLQRRREQLLDGAGFFGRRAWRGARFERRIRRRVEQDLRDQHVGGAVAHAVMRPCDQRAAAAHAVDHVHVPQRARVVERRAGQVADQFRERGVIARRGQGDMVHLLLDGEAGHRLPVRRGIRQPRLHDPLAEAAKAGQPVRVHALDLLEIERRPGDQDAGDQRRIGGAVHVEPHGVPGGHGAAAHRDLLGATLFSP